MEKLLGIIASIIIIFGIYFMGQYMAAERACYNAGKTVLEEYEVRYRTLNVTAETYCRYTYESIEVLDACITTAINKVPTVLMFITKLVDDFETLTQYRIKSLPAIKVQHDEVCAVFPDYRYSDPQ